MMKKNITIVVLAAAAVLAGCATQKPIGADSLGDYVTGTKPIELLLSSEDNPMRHFEMEEAAWGKWNRDPQIDALYRVCHARGGKVVGGADSWYRIIKKYDDVMLQGWRMADDQKIRIAFETDGLMRFVINEGSVHQRLTQAPELISLVPITRIGLSSNAERIAGFMRGLLSSKTQQDKRDRVGDFVCIEQTTGKQKFGWFVWPTKVYSASRVKFVVGIGGE